jgi:hypothetical protein
MGKCFKKICVYYVNNMFSNLFQNVKINVLGYEQLKTLVTHSGNNITDWELGASPVPLE